MASSFRLGMISFGQMNTSIWRPDWNSFPSARNTLFSSLVPIGHTFCTYGSLSTTPRVTGKPFLPNTNATEQAQQYDSVLTTLIDFHASLVTKMVSPKSPNRWMTPDILASERHRRYLEHVWRKNPTALNRSRLTRQNHLCNRQMSKEKSAHYSEIIV